ncbi:hypothetical protein [Novosphingobium sp.]|uniref:hypothetical protein n=1 Tax=Novosphingobium sp. TaxID=1874826 RepID=UPI00262A3EEA|nr:hypothetical protein [Novosphingobium sp.]
MAQAERAEGSAVPAPAESGAIIMTKIIPVTLAAVLTFINFAVICLAPAWA